MEENKPTRRIVPSLLAFLALFAWTPQARSGGLQQLHGHIPPDVAFSTRMGRLPADGRLHLTLALPFQNPGGLQTLLRRLYDPSSPSYRHFLTPAQFTALFGPSASDYQALMDFAASKGLTVERTHPNRMLLDVGGSVAQVEKAFYVHLYHYRRPDGRVFFAADAEPSLDLAVSVLRVGGLDNAVVPRPLLKALPLGAGVPLPNATGSGPGSLFIGNDFRTAYAAGVTLSGTGQSVALFELDTYFPADIAGYEKQAGLPNVPLQDVYLDGLSAASAPGPNNLETALDIEMAISMAPGQARVIVYQGNNVDDVLNRIASDDSAQQISSSWAWAPFSSTEQQIFQQYQAQGQAFFEASGDSGAYLNGTGLTGWVTEQPLLTCVGGTVLSLGGPASSAVSESAWPGSGGGISSDVALPSYQQGVVMTANLGSTAMRNLPDVAAVAGNIFLLADNGQQFTVSGTSCAAPLWAAFWALADQQSAALGKGSLGFADPSLYAIGQGSAYTLSFHDVDDGSTNGFYAAVAGYDLATGWGSPSGQALINALTGVAAVSSPTPSPSRTLTSSPTPTRTATATRTPTSTPSPLRTPPPLPSATPTSTSGAASPTSTPTRIFRRFHTPTPTSTPTDSPTDTDTTTPSFTPTNTATFTFSATPTATFSPTPTPTPTWTPTRRFFRPLPPTDTPTPTATPATASVAAAQPLSSGQSMGGGITPSPSPSPIPATSILSVARVLNYPNPLTQAGTTLYFELSGGTAPVAAGARVALKIFTLDGDLVWEKTLAGPEDLSMGGHGYRWDGKDAGGTALADGVYLFQVTARSGGKTSSSVSKIMILK